MKKENRFGQRKKKLVSSEEACTLFFLTHGGKERTHLTALWKHWDTVMGEEIAALGSPLGHTNKTLTVGGSDSMALQELSLQSYEILERANAFMDSEYFAQIKVVLLLGQEPLNRIRARRSAKRILPQLPPMPPRLGGLMGSLNPDSPVTKCYEAYVRLFTQSAPTT